MSRSTTIQATVKRRLKLNRDSSGKIQFSPSDRLQLKARHEKMEAVLNGLSDAKLRERLLRAVEENVQNRKPILKDNFSARLVEDLDFGAMF